MKAENNLEAIAVDGADDPSLRLIHARQRLSEFLLEKTQDLLLKLVQAGVAAGATKLELESKATQMTFTMHGVVFPPDSLGQILHCLLCEQEATQRSLRHLAIAVNTAVTTRPTAIVLAEWDGKNNGRLYRWISRGKEVLPWRPGMTAQPIAQPLVTFQLLRTPEEFKNNVFHLLSQRDVLSLFFGTRRGWDPDRLMLLERGCWCPIPLWMNGKLMDESPLVIGCDRATQKEIHLKHKSEYRLPAGPGGQGVRATVRKVWPWPGHEFPPGPWEAVVTVGREDIYAQVPSYIEFIMDGITVARRMILGHPPDTFVCIVAAADVFPSDLTGLKLIKDEQLTQLSNRVLGHAAQMFVTARLSKELPNLSMAPM